MAQHLARQRKKAALPRIDSFADFLTHHARVKSGSGYVPYHFRGRDALRPIVAQIDSIVASGATDASLALCGGAQFGKTVLMLNLLAYLVAVQFRNVGYYLPDDDLVSGLVDGKLRPDVLDQIPWLARLLQVGKTLAPSGRAVNRKGAFLCTDGERSALAFMRGLGKIPTSFSMDVVIQDEKDDLPEEHARFLSGRMTASNLRFSLIIGTQRYHGAGQNLAFTEGTQHIGLVRCPGCGARHNPETEWPGVCRLRLRNEEGRSKKLEVRNGQEAHAFSMAEAPRLTREGNFANEERRAKNSELGSGQVSTTSLGPSEFSVLSSTLIPYTPGQEYYLGCPKCGAELDRANPEWHALAPERAAQRKWSYRLSQLLFPDIDLAQIVAAWQLAIRDPAHMNVFCTDRLALPKSSTQTLTPHDLQAARGDYALGSQDQITGINPINEISEGKGSTTPNLNRIIGIEGHERHEAENIDNGNMRVGSLVSDASSSVSIPVSHGSPVQRSAELSPNSNSIPEFGNSVHSVNLVLPSICYAGLDMGDQCWFVARAIEARAPHRARLLWIEAIAAERVRSRVPELFRELNLRALCVDAGPLRDLSRDLAFTLNELGEDAAASTDDASRNIFFTRGGATLPLRWLASNERWDNVRCVPVEFTQREGQGVRHKVARTQDGRIYPLLAAHRDESIERVIAELLPTEAERPRVIDAPDGVATALTGPRFLLPQPAESTRGVLELYERHLLAGARQERSADGKTLRYLDKCENHFLLATAYAALAELIAPVREAATHAARLPAFRALPPVRHRAARAMVG